MSALMYRIVAESLSSGSILCTCVCVGMFVYVHVCVCAFVPMCVCVCVCVWECVRVLLCFLMQ